MEANSLAKTIELPVNMTEHGTEFVLFFFLIHIGNKISMLFEILVLSYTEFIQICNFLYCLIMIMSCDCWNIISQKAGSFVT